MADLSKLSLDLDLLTCEMILTGINDYSVILCGNSPIIFQPFICNNTCVYMDFDNFLAIAINSVRVNLFACLI